MTGQHKPHEARNVTWRDCLAINLDELLTALEESIADLTDEQLAAFPIPGRNNIAWIVMHCLGNLSEHAGGSQTGHRDIPSERRWSLWECKPEERPKPGDPFPGRERLLALLKQVRARADEGLATATDENLRGPRFADGWWKKTAADAYMRTISHTSAHIRQIWLLRGALGLTDGKTWPQQHWC